MAEIRTYDEIRQKSKKKKKIKRAIWLVIIILLSLFLYLQRDAISSLGIDGWFNSLIREETTETLTSNIPAGEDKTIVNIGSDLAIFQTGEIGYYDMMGEAINIVKLNMQNPIPIVSDDRIIAADIGAYGMYVTNGDEVLWNTSLPNTIVGLSVSDDGNIVVTTDHDRFSSHVTVYNKSYTEIFAYSSSEHKIISTDLSEKYLLVSGITTIDGKLSCRVGIIPLDGSDKIFVDMGDEFIFDVSFREDGNISLLSDTGVSVWSLSGEKLAGYQYNDNIDYYLVNEDGSVIILEGDYSKTRNSKIVALNHDMTIKYEYQFDKPVTKIINRDDSLLIASSKEVYDLNSDLELTTLIEVATVEDITLLNNSLYVLTDRNLYSIG